MTRKQQLNSLIVSRETKKNLKEYVSTIQNWNKAINLVSRVSINNIWDRHIMDSAQLSLFLTVNKKIWLDMGSGAGFPGIVIAIIAKEKFPGLKTVLIESDKRKCVFLEEVSRKLNLNITTICNRIEDCSCLNADIISARALAPMEKLLWYFKLHSKIETKGLFLKGKNVDSELNNVSDLNKFEIKMTPSIIDKLGFVVEVEKRKF